MSYRSQIFIHADDFGMMPHSNARICECWEKGCINGVSVMVNGSQPVLESKQNAIAAALHLNLVEGKSLSDPAKVPLLVRGDGFLKHSFFDLLMLSLSQRRKALEQQLYLEIDAQITQFCRLYPQNGALSLDSHQHTHMIPLVFRTMLRVIRDRKLKVNYLRVPAEPIGPFLAEPSLYASYRPVNLVKNAVLNVLWLFNRREFRKSGIPTAIFCGIVFSGEMDERRLTKVFPHFLRLAQRKKMNLELLFHPGAILPDEAFLDPDKTGFCDFYLSPGRQTDAETLCSQSWCEMVKPGTEENRAAGMMTI